MVCPRIGDSLRKMSPFLMCWIINCYRAELKCFQLQWSISIEHNLWQKKLTLNLEAQHCIQLSNNSLVQFFRKLLKKKIDIICDWTNLPMYSPASKQPHFVHVKHQRCHCFSRANNDWPLRISSPQPAHPKEKFTALKIRGKPIIP